jgi:DNA-binding transcriptional regulator YhcF (GntR family)
MQLWFSRTSEISIREQLATQIVLGIVSGELSPGARLPSTRELARRFRLHPNTVSAGYRQLQRSNWVDFRKGSGIYVAAQKPPLTSDGVVLDQLIADLFRSARKLNAPLTEVRSRLRRWLELQPPDHFLLLEPDPHLAAILVHEIRSAITFDVRSCEPQNYKSSSEGAIPISVSFSLKSAREVVPKETEILVLQLSSAGASLARHLPASKTALIGIASGWQPFLKNARTMLIAAGFDPDCLVLRDTTKLNWRRGLAEAAAVVCDSLTAQTLDQTPCVLSFSLLSESSLKELRDSEQFIRTPLAP